MYPIFSYTFLEKNPYVQLFRMEYVQWLVRLEYIYPHKYNTC